MQHLIEKYLRKLEAHRLANSGDAVFLALDAELFSNKPIKDDVLILSRVFDLMNINTILFSRPLEPYRSIIDELTSGQGKGLDKIVPMDCETRTFFHDIPVIDSFSPDAIAKALSHRKSVIIRDRGIVTYGVVTPEQAFVSFSSTCFSTFVKYFYDALLYFEKCRVHNIPSDDEFVKKFNKICELVEGHISATIKSFQPSALLPQKIFDFWGTPVFSFQPDLTALPANEDDVIKMLSEAGRAVVEYHLVDSYFGNISYVFGDKIYISQTGSSMDELECCIDAVPLDGSSSVGITSSSELSAHKNIYYTTGDNAILHGHPKFAVIMSMYCDKRECEYYFSRDMCHKGCKVKRDILGIPIVSGEIGRGPTALMHTVPLAMREGKGVIVYGHGVFTAGRDNFQKPFNMLVDIENRCMNEYFKKVQWPCGKGLSL